MRRVLLLAALLTPGIAFAEDADCKARRSKLLAAKIALATCLAGVDTCADRFRALEEAQMLGGCERAPNAEMIETSYGHDAVLLDAPASEDAALRFLVRRHVGTAEVLDRERIRELQKERGEPRKLRDGFLEELRGAAKVDRLVAVEVGRTAAGKSIDVRVVQPDAEVTQRSATAPDDEMLDTLDTALRDLPEFEMTLSRVPRPHVFRPHPAYTQDAAFADIGAFVGRRELPRSQWGDLAAQSEIGAYATVGGAEWPAHVAIEWFGSEAVDDGRKAIIGEVAVGARRTWDVWFLARLQLGGGVEVARVRIEREKEEVPGAWVSGGAFLRIVWINVGVVTRYSTATAEIGGRRFDGGGFQYGVVVGLGSSEYF